MRPVIPLAAPLALSTPVLLMVLLLLLMLTPGAQAGTAYVEGETVYLPIVDDYPQTYSLQLRILRGTFPLELRVVRSGAPEGIIVPTSSYYEGSLLVVPVVWINGLSYWAELRELSADLFRLEGYGLNRQPATSSYQHIGWDLMPGEARDIGVGADGTVWAVGASEYGDDYGLYSWDGHRWRENRGSAVRVDVDPWGNPWIINSENRIYRLRNGYWERLPGYATDIGIGADGSVWVVGVDERRGGNSLYTWVNGLWRKMDGAGVRIDVDRFGAPWVINEDEQIYKLENGTWRRVPGKAKDIGIGADGTVWVIGVDERAGGYGVYRYTGSDWEKVQGSGTQISVGPNGEPWVVNRDGDVFRSWGY